MAEKDKTERLRVFYNNLHFEPVEELRKKRDYSRRILFREVLDIGAQLDDELLVYVIMLPLNRSLWLKPDDDLSNSITVLPQWLPSKEGEILEESDIKRFLLAIQSNRPMTQSDTNEGLRNVGMIKWNQEAGYLENTPYTYVGKRLLKVANDYIAAIGAFSRGVEVQ